MLDIAVVIVSWNVRGYLADCLRSLFVEAANSALGIEIWVVDNASADGTVEMLEALYPQVHVIRNDGNPGFGAANNQGMRIAETYGPRYYFLLNPDTLLGKGALTHLVACLDERPRAAIAGARLVYGDGRFQHSAFYFPGLTQLAFDLFPLPERLYESRLNGRYPRHQYRSQAKPFAVDHPLGATMLVRSEVVESVGGFDESYFMYCEEIDWCWRIREAGWDIYVVPAAEVVHFGGKSTEQVEARSVIDLWQSRARLYHRHYSRLRNILAVYLVKLGMQRKAAQTTDPELKRAYRQIVTIWQSANGI